MLAKVTAAPPSFVAVTICGAALGPNRLAAKIQARGRKLHCGRGARELDELRLRGRAVDNRNQSSETARALRLKHGGDRAACPGGHHLSACAPHLKFPRQLDRTDRKTGPPPVG